MSKVKPPELKFRKFLDKAMEGLWKFTWHEDREISPGVPDLHYVMVESGSRFCVGWLELKAQDENLTKSQRIGVEPSQHQYIRRWNDHMQIDFLIRIKDWVYLVRGEHSATISRCTSTAEMALTSEWNCHQDEMAVMLSAYLRNRTRIK